MMLLTEVLTHRSRKGRICAHDLAAQVRALRLPPERVADEADGRAAEPEGAHLMSRRTEGARRSRSRVGDCGSTSARVCGGGRGAGAMYEIRTSYARRRRTDGRDC
jgi:hypothetical protein